MKRVLVIAIGAVVCGIAWPIVGTIYDNVKAASRPVPTEATAPIGMDRSELWTKFRRPWMILQDKTAGHVEESWDFETIDIHLTDGKVTWVRTVESHLGAALLPP